MELVKWRNVGKGVRNKTRRAYNECRYTHKSFCNNHIKPESYKPIRQFSLEHGISIAQIKSQLKYGYLEAVTLKNKLYVRKAIINEEQP